MALVSLILVSYFLKTQADAIRGLIGRIKAISVLGGTLEAEKVPYPEVSTTLPPLPVAADSNAQTSDSSKTLKTLERDFGRFIWESLQVNRGTMHNLMGVIWEKYGYRLFNPQTTLFRDKLQVVRSRLDQRAFDDMQLVETADKPPSSRNDLLTLHIKSQQLVDYLRGLATRG